MIFLVQFGINKHLLIFQRPQIALALRARVILLVFEKIYSCLFIPNCSRYHVITYTNYIDLNDTFFLFSPDLISKLKSNSKISKNVPFYLFIVELPLSPLLCH